LIRIDIHLMPEKYDMSATQILLAELKQEAANTKKVLERIPMDKYSWKPHEKSMTLGRLAVHIAEMPEWLTMTLTTDELDFGKGKYKPTVVNTSEELMDIYETKLAAAVQSLEAATEEDLNKLWCLKNGGHVIFTLPKAAVIRSMVFNHIVHHRAQLGVYLRLLDIPIPGMYGPSADDK